MSDTEISSERLPTYFIPHGGGPCFFMDWNPPDTWKSLGAWLSRIGAEVGARPKAVIVVSAHWEAPSFSVTGAAQPALIYDYQGFPPHTYQLRYPAPGAPELAQRISSLLSGAGLSAQIDAARGWDHGVFIPFKLIYPQADVPIVQLSLKRGLSPAEHIAAGRALAPLRDEGVLIVGSGYSYHNMRGYGGAGEQAAAEFDSWLSTAMTQHTSADREALLREWERAPSARAAHPREEHLLPLMVVAGAAADDTGQRVFGEQVWKIATSGFRFG
ncbi:MAG: Aromatic ring-opening dioxygenase, catalytic subunit, LigB family [Hydrocarboniphaga sp.]|uniref:DODA-type extradiol aromatic ring-opening family dioxygenase n=1 Tax=Hydrocarboniphaga sp. TaxID=2033016 RepID=UPI00261E35BD|nr:class III extradiol ring-cleavage dioxygenase [Hydrocarboniphaga sp.]MDB5968434.1 Aromatic ring-opening dioxygenase, catalytic subunit, LigB family [Hydrocarboniphaga sp.]